MDPKRVILVRKINKLGLESARMLETYFARFGDVERTFVTHSAEKGKSVDGAAAVLQREEHTILGVTILAGSYQDNHSTPTLDQPTQTSAPDSK
jgi:hypothetical protein